MYLLKQIPEDFKVKEIPDREFRKEGRYLICILEKKSYNTEDAIFTLAKSLGTIRKNISYAGTKDRNALTQQLISLYMGSEEKISKVNLKNISIKPIGRAKTPLSLGDLKGNDFEITIRNLDPETKLKKLDKFPNYYDSQRFSTKNVEIGRAIIKKDFETACKIISEDNKYGAAIKERLEKEPKNYIEALEHVPHKILLLYVHSFQSYLWNKTVEIYLKKHPDSKQKQIPLVGFSEIEDKEIQEIVDKLLKEEKLTPRDFINRAFPNLSIEGSKRKIFVDIENLEISALEDDELNEGKKKVKVKFFLEKGAYATMAIKYLVS